MALITVRCAWCPEKKEIGKIEGGEKEGEISHGICPECYEEKMAEIKKMKETQEKKDIGEKPTEPKFPLK